MRIQQLIVQVNSTFSLLLAFLVCVSAVRSFQSTEVAEGLLLAKLFDPVTEEVDETVAELLWNNCKLDLKEVDEDLNFCFLEETSGRTSNLNPKGWSLSKQNMQQLFRAPHPQLRQTLLDCIRKNDLVYAVYGEEPGSSMQYIQHLNSFLKSSVPARTLRESSANPPTSAPSPQLTPHSSPSGVKTTSRKLHQAADESESDAEEDAEDSKILIAVVATAISTSILAALLFFCCLRVFGTGGDGLNDDKPLLSLSSLSDSASSSYKSFSLGSSFKDDKFGSLSLSSNSNHHRKNSSIDGNMLSGDAIIASMEGNAGATKFSSEFGDTSMAGNGVLPPPPGRNTGLPPLNPPPGRAIPLPPEPPAPRRLPSKVAPPPPAPPPLPPSKASANAAPAPPPPGPPPPPPPALRGAPGAPPPPPGSRPPGPPPPGPPPPRGGPGPPRGPPPLGSKVPRAPGMRGPDGDDSKAKLKPFFWDKVLANPDQTMVWHQIKAGSFQFNEEMIENLFGYQAPDKSRTDRKKDASHEPASQFIQILEPKKAQNLSILLRALNVTTEEVSDALLEGNELPAELIQTLLKMAPTSDEELKLRLFSGELSQLGPAERFLKALVDIPFPFHRMEALLFMGTLEEEIANAMESFKALEVASKEVRNSRLFLKLLEAVLKTGNRMNDGTFRGGAQAFKLDTLLKLSDVKGVDGKTTLLHFVVQEIVRSEGVRAARARRESRSFSNVSVMTEDLLAEISPDTEDHYRALGLQVVSRLSSELENVKKAAAIDADNLTGTVAKLGHAQLKTREFLNKEMKDLDEDSGFHEVLKSFVQSSEGEVISLLEEEKRITALVKSTGDYFHGNSGRDEGLRLFTIVRDFLVILDKVCKEVGEAQKKSTTKALKKEASTASSNSNTTNTTTQSRPPPPTDPRTKLMPAIAERRMQNSSSSSDSSDDDSD